MIRPDPLVIGRVLGRLADSVGKMELPAVEKIARKRTRTAFHVLIGTLLSARTQDNTTHAAAERLFDVAGTPEEMARLPVRRIERLIYPVSFYRTKARHVKATSRAIVETFDGRVPATMEELLTLPGVGRKTANLVLIVAHQSPDNICVDTHVHRISNRLGWVETRTPDKTEQALYRVIPRRWWPDVNLYLVIWGQRICRPIRPRCSACSISALCPRVGVEEVPPAARKRSPAAPGRLPRVPEGTRR
jgi:endonuclease III